MNTIKGRIKKNFKKLMIDFLVKGINNGVFPDETRENIIKLYNSAGFQEFLKQIKKERDFIVDINPKICFSKYRWDNYQGVYESGFIFPIPITAINKKPVTLATQKGLDYIQKLH